MLCALYSVLRTIVQGYINQPLIHDSLFYLCIQVYAIKNNVPRAPKSSPKCENPAETAGIRAVNCIQSSSSVLKIWNKTKRKRGGSELEILMEQESQNWIAYSVPPGRSFEALLAGRHLRRFYGRASSDWRWPKAGKDKRVTGLFIPKECKKLADKHSRK